MAIVHPLALVKVPANITGIYGKKENLFPDRMRYLAPEAVSGFLSLFSQLGGGLVLSDMYRSAKASFRRKYEGRVFPRRGVARPAFSAHNFGFAMDVAVDRTLEGGGFADKAHMDSAFAVHGWFCHRTDHRRGSEDWHYNFLGPNFKPTGKRTSGDIEARIKTLYSRWWSLSTLQIQMCLKQLGYKPGPFDGVLGKGTKGAIRGFQKDWRLKADGVPGDMTCRTLWYICAERISFSQK